jgi:hypothetical protein
MKILGLKKIEDDGCDDEDYDWEISFTLEGSSMVRYDYVQEKDEMKAYLKALNVVKRWQKSHLAEQITQLKADLEGFKELHELMPSVNLSEDIANTKKLLTDVNQRVKALNK